MLPQITVFGRQISMYGCMAALGLGLAVLYFEWSERRRLGRCSGDTELAFVCGGIGGLLGAKALSLATMLPQLLRDLPGLTGDPAGFARRYLAAGFVFYGGLFGAILGMGLYVRLSGTSLSERAKSLTPAFALFAACGRVGCFLEGCCYGRPAKLLPGVTFTRSPIAPKGVPLVPVQLWEAGAELVLFLLLDGLVRRGKDGRAVLGTYLLCYGPVRFVLEFFRGDAYRGFIGPVSLSQALSLAAIALGLWLLRREREEDPPPVL